MHPTVSHHENRNCLTNPVSHQIIFSIGVYSARLQRCGAFLLFHAPLGLFSLHSLVQIFVERSPRYQLVYLDLAKSSLIAASLADTPPPLSPRPVDCPRLLFSLKPQEPKVFAIMMKGINPQCYYTYPPILPDI